MAEEWRAIVGWEDAYAVSSEGRVKSLGRVMEIPGYTRPDRPHPVGPSQRHHRERIMRLANVGGYAYAHLRRPGVSHHVGVHVLVLTAFVGPCPDGMEGAHEDGDRQNNVTSNLRWSTRVDNAADRIRHGTGNAGERHPLAKLTAADVLAIRAELAAGRLPAHIAKDYGVGRAQIGRIRHGKSWRSV